MSHLYSLQQTTATPTLASRKVANKQRRQAGRERHEERKNQLKAHELDRKWQRLERDSQRQEKRPDDGTRAFAGRNLDNQRATCSHVQPATGTVAAAAESCDFEHEDEDEVVSRVDGQVVDVPLATSGAMLLAMARPAKIHGGRRRRGRRLSMLEMTDGELFEVVEIDGRLVALDEDGWEVLPDENAEASLLYSDIVRGDVR